MTHTHTTHQYPLHCPSLGRAPPSPRLLAATLLGGKWWFMFEGLGENKLYREHNRRDDMFKTPRIIT